MSLPETTAQAASENLSTNDSREVSMTNLNSVESPPAHPTDMDPSAGTPAHHKEIYASAAPRGLWASVREALRGTHQDYTIGSLNRSIFLLAIPMVLEMVLESLFAVVDVFWVGRLGANAVATVGITETMLSLVFAIGMGVSLLGDGDGGTAHW